MLPLPYGQPFFGPVPHTGTIYFVGHGYANAADVVSNGRDPVKPFNTIAYAVTQASANNGDIVYVMPGHTETVSAAAGIAISTAGVTVQGMNAGSMRPVITFDTAATATLAITADNVTLRNLVFSANFADIAYCITTTKANTVVDNCEFQDTGANLNWLSIIKANGTTTGANDGLTVTNCRWTSPDAACTEFIEINGTLARLRVERNFVQHAGTASAQLVSCATGKVFTGAFIAWNFIQHAMTANELLVLNDGSTCSGIIAHNRCGHADVTSTHDLGIDALGCRLFDNLSTSTDSLSGFVLPAIDANS